jgi:hypothetical protein
MPKWSIATNFGSICLFVLKGKNNWAIAIPWLLATLWVDG